MRFFIRSTSLIAGLIITIASTTFGQKNLLGYEIGINVGTLIYQGELSPASYGNTSSLKPAIGLYLSKSLDPYFSLRANLTRGRIMADESIYSTPAWRQNRNLKFSSSLTEVAAMVVFNPYGESSRRFSPYIFAGGGVTFLNVKRNWSGFNSTYFDIKSAAAISLAADTIHTVPKVVAVLPVGLGLKYLITQRFAINAEATWRITSSDYIDGFKYQDPANKRDTYYGLSVGLSYRFVKDKYACPTVLRL